MRCQRWALLPFLTGLCATLVAGTLTACGPPDDGSRTKQRERGVMVAPGDVPPADPNDPRSSSGPGDPGPGQRSSGPGTDDPGPGQSHRVIPSPDGPARVVVLVLSAGPDLPSEAAIVLLGFRPIDVTARGALKPGRRPQWYWTSPMQVIAPGELRVEVPLPTGLALFALLDLDGDLAPGDGEFMSAIQREVMPPSPARFILDRRFGVD